VKSIPVPGAQTSKLLKINDLLSDVLQQPAPGVVSSTVLGDIPGWDSIVMVRLMLVLEERLGREMTESEIEAVVTVADVMRLLGPE
jgi:acyl carrier protein